MPRTDISNSDDIIDSRDIIARIAELEGERDDYVPDDADDNMLADPVDFSRQEWAIANPDDASELATLIALADEASGYSDWTHGATLIRDSYFVTYAQQFAEDIGAIQDESSWPCTCIDWEEAARQLQQDYTSVEFDGTTYWIR